VILLDLAPLAILGAILGLDVVSFPQAMVSRPLVAATLAGASPDEVSWAGALLVLGLWAGVFMVAGLLVDARRDVE
jgi:PTS system mannose-specific IIC component